MVVQAGHDEDLGLAGPPRDGDHPVPVIAVHDVDVPGRDRRLPYGPGQDDGAPDDVPTAGWSGSS